MGLIEAIIVGLQFRRLEKPFVFISMLLAMVCFTAMGVVIVLAGIEVLSSGKGLFSALSVALLSLVFFGLAAVCGHYVKKSVQ